MKNLSWKETKSRPDRLDDHAIKPLTEARDAIEQMLADTGILFDELADLAANI